MSAGNVQKTPFGRSINQFAEHRIQETIQLLGQGLPAVVESVSGSIVKVSFPVNSSPFTLPQVTVPVNGPEYIRYPIQKGCKGVVLPVNGARIGGVTGLGDGNADLALSANLSSLVFFPVGNAKWSDTDDPNKLVLYGPDGVVIRDLNSKTKITLTADGVTVDLQAGKKLTVNGTLAVTGDLNIGGEIKSETGGTYSGALQTTGDVIAGVGGIDQVGLKTHTHGGVTGGPSNTTSPNPGT